MKILVIAPMPFFLDRETQIRVLEEASALEKMENNVSIVAYGVGQTVFAEEWKRANVFPAGEKLFRNRKPESDWGLLRFLADFLVFWRALSLARETKPDIIHTHLRAGALIGFWVRKFLRGKNIPLVTDFHGWPSETEKMSWLDKKIVNFGDTAIASTEKSAEKLLALRNNKPVETVFDGVNVVRFLGLPPKMSEKSDLELPADQPIIVYVGSLSQARGIDYLLEAIPLVLREHPGAFFVIAGSPSSRVVEHISTKGLEKSVRLVDPLSYFEMPKILNAGDIGVDPKDSLEPEASWKVLQYMAAGLPVVCFDRKNNENYVGEGAYLAPEISGKGLADGIVYLLKNSFEAEKRGEFNQRKVSEYSWSHSAELIGGIYCNLLKNCK
jgi:glycosyltransferase involved in cell wall biosynthesis